MVPLRKMISVFMSDSCRVVLLGALLAFAVAPASVSAATYTPQAPNGAPVRVCMPDTGVADGTAGVVERLTATGSLEPTSPHGTQMAAIIRAAYPSAQIVSVQRSGGPTTITIAEVIDLCVARGAQVISMSFTLTDGGYDRPALQAAVDRARAAGVLLVGAAGNERRIEAPADLPGVIGVGAVDGDGDTCAFSAAGHGLLMALGCDVENVDSQGTSDAAAYVAGTAAAIIGTQGLSGAALESVVRAHPGLRGQASEEAFRPSVTRKVQIAVKRLKGRRVQIKVLGRQRGDVLFVRAGKREIMRRNGRVVLHIPHRVHRITVTVTSEDTTLARVTRRLR